MLETAEPGATFLLNSPFGPDQVWQKVPAHIQRTIIEKRLRLHVVDAMKVAGDAGLGGGSTRSCRPASSLSRVSSPATRRSSISRGDRQDVREAGRGRAGAELRGRRRRSHRCTRSRIPAVITGERMLESLDPGTEPDFIRRITAVIMEGKGDLLPVSALPVDGTFPTGTARFEKRSIAQEIPIWDPEICIQCGLCALVCPHAVIRIKVYEPSALGRRPTGFRSRPWTGKELPGHHMTIQVAPDDCTGCGICVDVCPAVSKSAAKHKAIDMETEVRQHLERERPVRDFFLGIPELDRTARRSTRSRARNCSSPCSSSPAPVPAAAKRPTSS